MKATTGMAMLAAVGLLLGSCQGGTADNGAKNTSNNSQSTMENIKKGKMEVVDLKGFKLHVYQTLDALGDVSFIIEGADSLVTLEHPLFKENVAEFNSYVEALGKPVAISIANYHPGGNADFKKIVMVEGYEEFEKGPAFSGMMGYFTQSFGETLDMRPHPKAEVVKFGETKSWAGVDFKFVPGASSDFPAASIVIGSQVYYSHWTPAKAHMSHLQVVSAAAIDAEIAEAQNTLNSGCSVFVGSHGGRATKAEVEFKLAYLTKAKELRASCADAKAWAEAMKVAFPGLPGEEGVEALAEAIYK